MTDDTNKHVSEQLSYSDLILCDNDINEQEMVDDNLQIEREENQIQSEMKMKEETESYTRPMKRDIHLVDTDWSIVENRKEKKRKEEKIQIYISCKDGMPKQLALAKLLKKEEINIKDITNIKYINKYKIRIDFLSDLSVSKLESNESLINQGWRFYRAYEKSYSYGVIKDIDMETSDDDIYKNITCPNGIQIMSARRLNKRDIVSSEHPWLPSEAVRLCFRGPNVPAFVYLDELRIKVFPYVFPVTQCSKCWKFGHPARLCSSKSVVCPKCGDNHVNCETSTFRCINCSGRHMAMYRNCPTYLREKKLRDIMAEFNCTYRKALDMYPVSENTSSELYNNQKLNSGEALTVIHEDVTPSTSSAPTPRMSYSNVLKTTATIHNPETPKYFARPKNKGKKSKIEFTDTKMELNLDEIQDESNDADLSANEECSEPNINNQREVHFSELLSRLKGIIFLKGQSFQQMFKNIIKCCVEWFVLVVVDSVSADWPVLNQIVDYFKNG
ncbi:unnamed protein product [Euphydryas editha]|uniref:Reverse transcriptase n=1 Tax=Euphydryas editha TaxID=104508 RepID=A0AAU9UX67_EUPED|nr:unnamed protein product [Euphydryas editha]